MVEPIALDFDIAADLFSFSGLDREAPCSFVDLVLTLACAITEWGGGGLSRETPGLQLLLTTALLIR